MILCLKEEEEEEEEKKKKKRRREEEEEEEEEEKEKKKKKKQTTSSHFMHSTYRPIPCPSSRPICRFMPKNPAITVLTAKLDVPIPILSAHRGDSTGRCTQRCK